MRKWICVLLAAMMLLGCLAGCTPAQDGPGKNPYNLTTVRSGYLTVATSPDYAPFEFYALDKNGKPTLAGFDISLAQYIADYLGLTLELVPMDFEGTINELGSKKCDLSMAGYSPDPDRLTYMDFTDIYYTSEQSFLTVKDKADQFSELADANTASCRIGVQIGSIQAELAKEHTPNADIVELTKVTDILTELIAGRLDGAYVETPVVKAYAASYPQLQIVCSVPYENNGSVLGVSKGNTALLQHVNDAIAAAKADGTFESYVAQAVELAAGDKFEGLLGEDGKVPEQ